MSQLKLKYNNLSQKIPFPTNFDQLNGHIQKQFDLSHESYSLESEEGIIQKQQDYQKLISKKNAKIKIVPKLTNYFLKVEGSQYQISSEAPKFDVQTFAEKERKYFKQKYQKQSKKETKKSCERFDGKIMHRDNQIEVDLDKSYENVWLKCVEGGMAGYQKKITKNGTIKLTTPWKSTWRLVREINNIKRPFGNKLIVEKESHVTYDRVDKVLNLAQRIKESLGGEIIRYIRFIRQNNLVDQSVESIIMAIIEDESFFA